MNRSEVLRIELSGTPLGKHSLNQVTLGRLYRGEKAVNPKGKEARILRRQDRQAGVLEEYEEQKLSRIASRVAAACQESGGLSTPQEVLSAEIRHLRAAAGEPLGKEILVTLFPADVQRR